MTPGELTGEYNFNQFWPGVIAVKDTEVRTVMVPIVPAGLFPTLKVPGVADIGTSGPENDKTSGYRRTFCFVTPTCIMRLPPHHRSVIGDMPDEINPSFIKKIVNDLADIPYDTPPSEMVDRLGYNLLFRFPASQTQKPIVKDESHPDLPDIPTISTSVKGVTMTEQVVQSIKRGVRYMNGLCVEQAESNGKGWARPEYPATSNGWEIVW